MALREVSRTLDFTLCKGMSLYGFEGKWHMFIYVLKESLWLLCGDLTVGRKEREQLGGYCNVQNRDNGDSFSGEGRISGQTYNEF